MLHSIVYIPVQGRGKLQNIPLLILQNGEVSVFALSWIRCISLDKGLSSMSVDKSIVALGKFYDFYEHEKGGVPLDQSGLTSLLKEFYEARRFGLKSLGWQGVKKATAFDDVRAINNFTDWCSDNFDHLPANPLERRWVTDLGAAQRHAAEASQSHRSKWSFLHHLEPSTKSGQGQIRQRVFAPNTRDSLTAATIEKSFPADKVLAFIQATPSIRDRLYFLLLFFGGVRVSEPLHLFLSDIRINPDGTSSVALGHPQDGSCSWIAGDKTKQQGNRSTMLSTKYNLIPRNLLGFSDPLQSGWKGMTLDNGKRMESTLHWLNDDASRLFAKLHAEYLKTFRGKLPDVHPYYFANERRGPTFGQPLTLSNITKSFYRSAERIGLSNADAGVNPHGSRHFYGFYCASLLRLPIETTQKLMHHQSMGSTQVYYNLTQGAVRKELIAAKERLAMSSMAIITTSHPLLLKASP